MSVSDFIQQSNPESELAIVPASSAENINETEFSSIGIGRKLPFTFAKRHGIVFRLADEDEAFKGVIEAAVKKNVTLAALAEARRFAGTKVRFNEVNENDFETILGEVYQDHSDSTQCYLGVIQK